MLNKYCTALRCTHKSETPTQTVALDFTSATYLFRLQIVCYFTPNHDGLRTLSSPSNVIIINIKLFKFHSEAMYAISSPVSMSH